MSFFKDFHSEIKMLVIVSIVAVVVSVGAILILKSIPSSTQVQPESQKVSVGVQPTEKPSVDGTADWETYRNGKYGYEVKYPPNLIKDEVISEFEHDFYLQWTAGEEGQPFLSFSVDENPRYLSINEYYDGDPGADLFGQTESEDIVDIIVAGYPAMNFNPYVTFAGGEVFIVSLGPWFLTVNDNGGSFRGVDLLDKILATIRFTELDPSNWKTYQSEEFGFEFKYPLQGKVEETKMLSTSHIRLYLGISHTNSGNLFLVERNDKQMSLEEFILDPYKNCIPEYELPCLPIPQLEDFRIGNISGLTDQYHYFFEKDDKTDLVYIFSGTVTQPVGIKVLSTFKFIEPIDTSDWQTYRNEEFGFEMKYPENWKLLEDSGHILESQAEDEYISIYSVPIKTGQEMLDVVMANTGMGECSPPNCRNPAEDEVFARNFGGNPFYYVFTNLFEGDLAVAYYVKNLDKSIAIRFRFFGRSGSENWPLRGDHSDEEEPNHDILKQILSTFRFIE